MENFSIDFILLYLAGKTIRGKVRLLPLLFSALLGTAFALFFPLLPLPSLLSAALKILFGGVICFLAYRKERLKILLSTTGIFYFYSFTLGGLLTAIYSFFGLEYTASGQFVISHAPLPLVLFSSAAFGILIRMLLPQILKKIKLKKKSVKCKLFLHGNSVETTALLDSGNLFLWREQPVSVISISLAARLIHDFSCVTKSHRVKVTTVSGEKELSVFQIEKMEIYSDGHAHTIEGVNLAVSSFLKDGIEMILNEAYSRLGGENENS